MDLTFLYRTFVVLLCLDVTISTPVNNKDNTQNGVRKSALENVLAELGKSPNDLKAMSKSQVTALLGELATKYENKNQEASKMEALEKKVQELEEMGHERDLRFDTLTIGEACSKMEGEKYTENFSVKKVVNKTVVQGIELIFNSSSYFLCKGREETVHKIISEESLEYLRNMDLLIDWACYCVEKFDDRTPEDDKYVQAIIKKLYFKNVKLNFLETKCKLASS